MESQYYWSKDKNGFIEWPMPHKDIEEAIYEMIGLMYGVTPLPKLDMLKNIKRAFEQKSVVELLVGEKENSKVYAKIKVNIDDKKQNADIFFEVIRYEYTEDGFNVTETFRNGRINKESHEIEKKRVTWRV